MSICICNDISGSITEKRQYLVYVRSIVNDEFSAINICVYHAELEMAVFEIARVYMYNDDYCDAQRDTT